MQVSDINIRLDLELIEWFRKQSQNLFNDYYLYYIESTPEHNGGFLIMSEVPPNKEFKRSVKLNKGMTTRQNFILLKQVINRLPIIES